MMSTFYPVLIGLVAGVIGYGIVAAVVALNALIKHKDLDYKRKYEEHLQQKRRVKDRLEMARESQTERH